MYTVQQLSKMYSCTRQTIYSKLEHEAIQQFLHKDDKGLKLIPEGLNVLNTIISDSKIRHDTQQVNNELDTKHTEKNEYIDMYINTLKAQIEELKLDKEKLQLDKEKLHEELKEQRKILFLVMPEQQEQQEQTKESIKYESEKKKGLITNLKNLFRN